MIALLDGDGGQHFNLDAYFEQSFGGSTGRIWATLGKCLDNLRPNSASAKANSADFGRKRPTLEELRPISGKSAAHSGARTKVGRIRPIFEATLTYECRVPNRPIPERCGPESVNLGQVCPTFGSIWCRSGIDLRSMFRSMSGRSCACPVKFSQHKASIDANTPRLGPTSAEVGPKSTNSLGKLGPESTNLVSWVDSGRCTEFGQFRPTLGQDPPIVDQCRSSVCGFRPNWANLGHAEAMLRPCCGRSRESSGQLRPKSANSPQSAKA